jgi:hypothetical protein
VVGLGPLEDLTLVGGAGEDLFSPPARAAAGTAERTARQPTRPEGATGDPGDRQSLNLIAYHVRVLHRYGAIELVDTESIRGATKHIYAANRKMLIDGDDRALPDRPEQRGYAPDGSRTPRRSV